MDKKLHERAIQGIKDYKKAPTMMKMALWDDDPAKQLGGIGMTFGFLLPVILFLMFIAAPLGMAVMGFLLILTIIAGARMIYADYIA